MASTDILPWAIGPGANVENQIAYAADPNLVNGYQYLAELPSNTLNKNLRQSSFIAAGWANWCVSQGVSIPDDGNLPGLVANLNTALTNFFSSTPIPGSFTTLTVSGSISGAAFISYFAAPPPIGNVTPNSGAFTNLAAQNLSVANTVSGTGFTNYFASPPPLGSTTPNTVRGTTLTSTSLTATRVPYSGAGGTLTDSANMTFDGTSLTLANVLQAPSVNGASTYAIQTGGTNALTVDASQVVTAVNDAIIHGLTVGTGGGAIATNAAFGYQALLSNVSGANSSAFGNNSLASNTSGQANTAVGSSALLLNTIGNRNAAFGGGTLSANISGDFNTAVGDSALNVNTVANNTAVGASALLKNITGTPNTAIGYQALGNNVSGAGNVAVGDNALAANTNGSNTAVGSGSLATNTSGAANTAIGQGSGTGITSGSYNTAIGRRSIPSGNGTSNTALGNESLGALTSGNANIDIGPCDATGAYNPAFSITNQNYYANFGSTLLTNAYIKVAWTVVSDARDKNVVGDVELGLDFVNKLQPKEFYFKKSREDDTNHGRLRYGFLAQDILALEGDKTVIIDAEDEDKLKYNEADLIPVLVNAIKELTARLEALEGAK